MPYVLTKKDVTEILEGIPDNNIVKVVVQYADSSLVEILPIDSETYKVTAIAEATCFAAPYVDATQASTFEYEELMKVKETIGKQRVAYGLLVMDDNTPRYIVKKNGKLEVVVSENKPPMPSNNTRH